MNDSTRQEQVLSFLFFDLDANGAVKAMLTLARGFIERGFKVDIVVLEAKGEGFKWLPTEARVVELKCRNRGFSKLVYLGSLVQYLRKLQPIALIAGDDINFGSIAKYLTRVRTRVVINFQTNLSNLF